MLSSRPIIRWRSKVRISPALIRKVPSLRGEETYVRLLAGTRQSVKFLHCVGVDLQLGGRYILFQMFYLGSSRDREHDGRSSQQPSQGQL